jgi:hypothetical protein
MKNGTEDPLTLELRLQWWKSRERVLLTGCILGFLWFSVVSVLALVLDQVHFWWAAVGLLAWAPVQIAWSFAKWRIDKVKTALSRAEIMEKFHAISSKYRERMKVT